MPTNKLPEINSEARTLRSKIASISRVPERANEIPELQRRLKVLRVEQLLMEVITVPTLTRADQQRMIRALRTADLVT